MPRNLIIVLVLTGFVHILTTMSYAMWIVGTRTQKIAVSFSLFNLIVILTRTFNTFQAPLLAKQVEVNILVPGSGSDELSFRIILAISSLATIGGALLIPTFQRFMARAVEYFAEVKSVPKLLVHGVSRRGFRNLQDALKFPDYKNLIQLTHAKAIPVKILAMNSITVAVLTVGFLSSLYAAYLKPELRVTSSNMAAVVTGVATVLLFVFVDPFLSVMTDEHVDGSISTPIFRQRIVLLAGSRFVGTVLAQIILVPAAWLIVRIAELI